jgi:hypothetical protein
MLTVTSQESEGELEVGEETSCATRTTGDMKISEHVE